MSKETQLNIFFNLPPRFVPRFFTTGNASRSRSSLLQSWQRSSKPSSIQTKWAAHFKSGVKFLHARLMQKTHASSIDHTGELIFTSSASPASRPPAPAPAPVFRRQGNARPRPRPPAPPWAFYSSSRVRRRPSSAAAEVTDNSVFDPTPNGESTSGRTDADGRTRCDPTRRHRVAIFCYLVGWYRPG